MLIQDQALRTDLGTPDVRYLLVIGAADTEYALKKLEQLDEPLQKLVAEGAITGYDHAARYVPTAEKQRQRQARLPEPATLRAGVDAAVKDTTVPTRCVRAVPATMYGRRVVCAC